MAKRNSIAEALASLRQMKGLGLGELASGSGLPEAQIAAIEEGKAVPTLAPLMRLSKALGVRLGTFFDAEPTEALVVTRRGEAVEAIRFGGKNATGSGGAPEIDFFSLAAGKADRHMEPFIVKIDPDDGTEGALSTHEGEEFVYVIEGRVLLRHGNEKRELGPGDSAYYESVVPHVLSGADGKRATALAVLYAPL